MKGFENFLEGARDFFQPQLELAQVGWEGTEEHFDKGDPDAGDTSYRHTLVRCTLFRSGNHVTNNNGKGACGYKLLCRVASSVGAIPAKGSLVYLAVGHEMHTQPGAHCIIAVLEGDQRHNLTAGQKVIAAGEGAAKVIANNDGSLSLFTTDDNTDTGKSVYLRVAKDGFAFVAPWGTLKFDGTGLHVLHSSGASFDLGGIYGLPSPLDQLGSYVKMSAAMIEGECSAASFGSGVADPLAASTPTLAAIAALQTELAAIAAALVAVAAITGPVTAAHATAAGAATAAVSAGASTLGTTTPLVPTATSSS